ncbi:acetate/propionate family kinase [Oceanivirga miroungae]|uniref:Acetate kinase n=1 Tax=Oceanivirga miroungae TaxID=1130046 RepID=A0A6I8M724_9FUSO|nr:acetate kinase [Oceanivirga miroungae]VWL85206.1 acetate kinase [Oceanivirga miroungae]
MKILVINSGSSSLKFEVIDTSTKQTLVNGICERIGISDQLFTYKNKVNSYVEKETKVSMPTHKDAIDHLLKVLTDEKIGVIKSIEELDAIGHRVVQGGEYFDDAVIVDEDVIAKIEELASLAPLHNPANVMGIKLMRELLPNTPNVAVFDTAFHRTMPDYAFRYPLPHEDYKKYKVRKYGAHGTSHKYVSSYVKDLLNKEDSKIIVCHLGNGASISAVRDGKVVDTSMGLTPLGGIMMGTRCGDMDPAVALYLMQKRELTASEMDTRLNKTSGLKAIFEKSSDFRDILKGMEENDEKAFLAFNMFCYRVRNFIGSYILALNGIDAIVFTGGIGENVAKVRRKVCENLEFLGIKMDTEKNEIRVDGTADYTAADSKVKILKVETKEELMIALDTERLVKGE